MSRRDYLAEVLAAHAAGDAAALAKLALELHTLAAPALQKREAAAERQRRSRETRGGAGHASHAIERDRAPERVTERDVTPTPFPPPSPPNPHKTTSPPPAPAVSHSAQGPSSEEAGVELEPAAAALAARLETPPDREALRLLIGAVPFAPSWLAEMAAALEGMHGPALSPAQLGDVLRDYVGNGHHQAANMRHFRSYLRRGARPMAGEGSGGAVAGHVGPSSSGRAPAAPSSSAGGRAALNPGHLLARIKAMAETSEVPGRGVNRFIPRAKVAELGADVLAAYDAIGGAAGVLEADGKGWGFLVRDFGQALRDGPPPEAAAGGSG